MKHPLTGADPFTLAAAFARGGRPDHWGRALGLAAGVAARAPFSALEAAASAPFLPRLEALPPPVFIVGHWRSGTTHLYNAMAASGFGAPSPFDVGLPWDMLGLGRALRPLLARALPSGREIDAVPVTPDSPQEDEVALASMTPLSFLHALYFPRRFDALLDRNLFFDGCAPGEIARRERRLTLFARKLSLRTRRRLVLKNPAHTPHVERLRGLFPGARFIHVHRDPLEVFRSMRRFYERLLPALALQRPGEIDLDGAILRVYRRMMTRLDEAAAALPPGVLVHVGHEALVRDPMGALARIHAELGLEDDDVARRARAAYFDSTRAYRRNRFDEAPEATERARAALEPWIERWGAGAAPR